MKKILITRKLINSSEEFATKVFDVKLNKEDKILTKEELLKESKDCHGILSTITEKFDKDLILHRITLMHFLHLILLAF